MSIKNMSDMDKPREKLVMYGSKALSDVELLAILIRNGDKERSALQLAEDVVAYNPKGIEFLNFCVPEQLSEIKGIGKAKACQILAATELGRRVVIREKKKGAALKNAGDVAKHLIEQMRHYNKEHFKVIMLNTKAEIIAEEDVAIGDLSATVIHPREIFNKAVKNSTASVIFAHNHPSGNPEPSSEDINVTNRLIKAGEILGIRVLDHLVIGDGKYVSLRERNLCDF